MADFPVTRARVLLVDDHPIVRQGMSQLIDATPDLHVTAAVEDAASALDQMKTNRPDVAVVDLTLKSGSGLDVVKELKAIGGDAFPVLVLSMHDEALHAERALRAGAQGYVMKEAATEAVLAAIRSVLRGEMYFSSHVTAKLLQRLALSKPGEEVSPLSKLSDRENEVFMLIGAGQAPRQMAATLGLSVKTVDAHRENIKLKLGFKSAAELARYAVHYAIDRRQSTLRGV